jgi:serine/threonine protein phosphatase 1
MTGPVARLLQRFTRGRRLTDLFEERPVDGPIWAVGDVHGCLDQYLDLEGRIAAEAAVTGQTQTVVVLGDVIDRGPKVKGVLDHLQAGPPQGLNRICLMGNHEDMLLRFLDRPRDSKAWLSFGAWPTLGSYGISPDPALSEQDVVKLAAELKATMGAATIAFLETLPVGLIVGEFVLAHAGVAPETPLSRQTRHDLIWARHGEVQDLLPPSDLGDRIVVHGHVPVEAPHVSGWRINIDTGAFATGRLTAVRLFAGDAPRFVSTGYR